MVDRNKMAIEIIFRRMFQLQSVWDTVKLKRTANPIEKLANCRGNRLLESPWKSDNGSSGDSKEIRGFFDTIRIRLRSVDSGCSNVRNEVGDILDNILVTICFFRTIDVEQRYDSFYRREKSLTKRSTVDFIHFWRTQEIYDYLDALAANYSNLAKVEVIGHTHQNRPIKAITISASGSHGNGSRPVIFIDGGVHAR